MNNTDEQKVPNPSPNTTASPSPGLFSQLRARTADDWSRWLKGAILVAGLFAFFLYMLFKNIDYSLHYGRLATIPRYDDVAYLFDSLVRFNFQLALGLEGFLDGIIAYPPHSPVTTLTGMIGFELFGPAALSAYLANGWILALYIASIAALSRPLGGIIPRLLFVAIFLFPRVVHAMITEFRPDMAAGLIFAIAIVMITSTDLQSASLQRRIGIALVAAAATVAKPSGLVVVVPGLGIALLATWLLQYRAGRGNLGGMLAHLIPAFVIYAIVLIPFFAIWGSETFGYIYSVLVVNADVWKSNIDLLQHLTFHLIGYGANRALLPFNSIGAIVIVIDLIQLWRSGSSREKTSAFALYTTLVLLYIGMAMSQEKTVYQGSYFYLPFLFAVAIGAARILSSIRQPYYVSGGLVALLLILAALRPLASSYSPVPDFGPGLKVLLSGVGDATTEFIKNRKKGPGCTNDVPQFLTTNPDPLSPESVGFELATRGHWIGVNASFLARTQQEVDEAIDQADLVLIADPAMVGLNHNLPGDAFAVATQARLQHDPNWLGKIVGTLDGQGLWLFERVACLAPPAPIAPPASTGS